MSVIVQRLGAFGRESESSLDTWCPACRAGEPDCPWPAGGEWPNWCNCMFGKPSDPVNWVGLVPRGPGNVPITWGSALTVLSGGLLGAAGVSSAAAEAQVFSWLPEDFRTDPNNRARIRNMIKCLLAYPAAPWTIAYDVMEAIQSEVPGLLVDEAAQCGIGINIPCQAIVAAQHVASALLKVPSIRDQHELATFLVVIRDGYDLIKRMGKLEDWKTVSLWRFLAETIHKVEDVVGPPGSPARDTAKTIADSIDIFAEPIKLIADGATSFDTNKLSMGVSLAVDNLADKVLHIKPSEFLRAMKLGDKSVRDYLKIRDVNLDAHATMQKIRGAMTNFVGALQSVREKDIPVLSGLLDYVKTLVDPVLKALGQVNDFWQHAQMYTGGTTDIPLPPDEQKRAQLAVQASNPYMERFAPLTQKLESTGFRNNRAMNTGAAIVRPSAQSRAWLTGAIAGGVVGGPVGAGIGLAAGAWLGKGDWRWSK